MNTYSYALCTASLKPVSCDKYSPYLFAKSSLKSEDTWKNVWFFSEQVLARLPYTTQVDMWAIGVIAYILLSGTMPFDDDNRTRLYRQILRAKYSYDGEVRCLYLILFAIHLTYLILTTLYCMNSVENKWRWRVTQGVQLTKARFPLPEFTGRVDCP